VMTGATAASQRVCGITAWIVVNVQVVDEDCQSRGSRRNLGLRSNINTSNGIRSHDFLIWPINGALFREGVHIVHRTFIG